MMPTKVTRSAADVVEWIVRATAKVGVSPGLPEVVGVHAQGALEAEWRQREGGDVDRKASATIIILVFSIIGIFLCTCERPT
jgi:hypothetical protein